MFCRRATLVIYLLCGAAAGSARAAEPTANPRRTPIVEVFEATHRAVVNISSTRIVDVRRSISILDHFFENFDDLLGPRVRRYKSNTVGSGFVVHGSGYIITNAHVVARTTDIKITFHDEQVYDAHVVARDHEHDLALLKIEPQSTLQVIKLGRSDDLLIGETAVVIGNPLGYQHSLTTGVISAVNRNLELTKPKTNQTVVYANLIQTDAPINPGNSGGPLLNVLGSVIGISTAIRGDAQNIGFAIPVDTLKEVLPIMLRDEQANRFSLGVEIDRERSVTRVAEHSPAELGGLLVGDVITRVERTTVASDVDFLFEMMGHKPGDRVRLDVRRADHLHTVRVLLQERGAPDGARLAWQKLGIRLRPLTRREVRERSVPQDVGLLVTEVAPGGPAQAVRMRTGDILTYLDRYHVTDLDEVGQLLDAVDPGDRVYVEILGLDGNRMFRDGTHLTAR